MPNEQKKFLDYAGLQRTIENIKGLLAEASVNITDTTAYKISGATDNLALPTQSQMELLEVRGNSVVRNMLISSLNGSLGTYASNIYTFTSVGIVGGNQNRLFTGQTSVVNGHQYLFVLTLKSSKGGSSNIGDYSASLGNAALGNLIDYSVSANTTTTIALIKTCTVTTTTDIRFGMPTTSTTAVGDTINVYQAYLVDLTQFFGGNVPSGLTAEQFLAEYGSMIPSTQDLGTIVNSKNNIVTTGVNIWDEEWEVGEIVFDNNCLQTKNLIRVKPNTDYYFWCKDNIFVGYYGFVVAYYDSGKNLISANTRLYTNVFTTPSNCHYMKFGVFVAYYGTTYNHDICINKSNSAINGKYYPYTAHTLTINETLRSAGSAYDKLVAKKKIVKVRTVDLGSLNWSYNSAGMGYWTATYIGGQKNHLGSAYVIGLSPFYKASNYDNGILGTINTFFYNDTTIYVNNGSSTAQPTGYLNYELATPTETDIDIVNYLPVYMNGTEQQTGDVPYTLVRNYDISVRDQAITNVKIDAKQQKLIDWLLANKEALLMTGVGIELERNHLNGMTLLSLTDSIKFQRWRNVVIVYNDSQVPQFIFTYYTNDSVDTGIIYRHAIPDFIREHWNGYIESGVWIKHTEEEIEKQSTYYEPGAGFAVNYSGLIGLKFDPNQSGAEFEATFYDESTQQTTTQTWDLSDFGDYENSTLFMQVVSSYRVG